MFLDSIRALFGATPAAGDRSKPVDSHAADTHAVDPLHLAACVLLLDVAHADGEFSDAEKAHLESVLERHFSLSPELGRRLIELADTERRNSIDHFQHTSTLLRGYDLGQKMVLAEVLWGLVLADGTIAEHEHYLARKIANLLELEPGYLAAAKAAAAKNRE